MDLEPLDCNTHILEGIEVISLSIHVKMLVYRFSQNRSSMLFFSEQMFLFIIHSWIQQDHDGLSVKEAVALFVGLSLIQHCRWRVLMLSGAFQPPHVFS